ncbi:MAG TPA: rod shape-determining protein MreC, partial [Methylophilus sp.]
VSRPIAGVNNHKHVLILKMPDAPASNTPQETKPAMPRNNAQHMDQSVVDVLQKQNAASDPQRMAPEAPMVTDSLPAEAVNADHAVATPPPAISNQGRP